ncbi:LlaJI family restriction endonuclease [Rossellomorea sp. GAMAL-10_SWC]
MDVSYSIDYEKELLGGIGGNNSISSAFWIMEDFINNGLINLQKEINSINTSGRINWNRTINKLNPVLSNGNPLYLDFFSKNRNVDINNIIYRIHKYAVYQSLKRFGWLISYPLEHEESDLIIDKDTAIHYLQIELQMTFIDREVNLYKNLIEFLNGSIENDKNNHIFTFLTPHFHTVWEKITDYIFDGIKDDEINIPRPYWNVKHKIKYTKQIPDTIFISENKLFIVDAKYYRVEKLPGWSDLVKQFFYANTLKVPLDIKNILIFPSSHKETIIKYLGYAAIENNDDLGYINGYTVDLIEAMKSYANYNKKHFKNILITLESNIKLQE